MNNQGLRGLVGQGMNARKPDVTPLVYNVLATPSGGDTPQTLTWTCPENGTWRFAAWGCGGRVTDNASSGPTGALIIADRPISKGQTVRIAMCDFWRSGAGSPPDTVITFPSGEVVTAGSGARAASGVAAGGVATINASMGDIGVNGTAGVAGTSSNAPAAPSYAGYAGGGAAPPSQLNGATPGGGSPPAVAGTPMSGSPMVIIHQVRMRP